MASIEKRTSKVGRTTTWRVKWRVGGTREGAWDGETCDDLTTARHFKALVEVAGEGKMSKAHRPARPAPCPLARLGGHVHLVRCRRDLPGHLDIALLSPPPSCLVRPPSRSVCPRSTSG